MRASLRAADRAYCRAVLPRVSRTFAINIRLLRGAMGDAVRVGYLLCRIADALEDSWPGAPEAVRERFALLQCAVAGSADAADQLAQRAAPIAAGRADLSLVAHFPEVWRSLNGLPPDHQVPLAECVKTLAGGMERYAARAAGRSADAPYLETEAELLDYCWVVAGCVGVMLTRLFALHEPGTTPDVETRREAAAPAVGEALQLTNILLDWPADLRRGRCFIPASWLAEFGLAPQDLLGAPRPGVRVIAERLEARARAALARVPDYLDLIPSRHVRYRLFCLWPALWAQASLRHARRDPEFPWGRRRPRLPRAELWGAALGSLFAAHHRGVLRRLYALHAGGPAPALGASGS